MALAAASDEEFRTLRDVIRERLGLYYDDQKRYLLLSRLQTRLARRGAESVAAYLRFLTSGALREAEWHELAVALTNNETYFFRERAQVRALTGPILDEIMAKSGRSLRVWSAACSTGEEPYSLAISLVDSGKLPATSIAIEATDVSQRVLDVARRGSYRPLSFRATEPAMLARWFLPEENDGFRISPAVQRIVSFSELNLMNAAAVASRGPFDVIFCRNVLIYFDKPTQKRVVESFAAALRPHGYLFLGHAESLFHLTERYAPVTFPDAIVYRLR